jgi:hypothetical protein
VVIASVPSLLYNHAELALQADDPAAAVLARTCAITVSGAERDKHAETLAGLADLEAIARPARQLSTDPDPDPHNAG